jgi:sortase A
VGPLVSDCKYLKSRTNSPQNLKRLETTLLVSGTALLTVFFLVRAWSDSSSSSGVAAFEQARAEIVEAQPVSTGAASPARFRGQSIPAPDFELWSEKRIREYEESLEASDNLPLAVLSIDKLSLKVPIYDGATDFNLNRGVARIKGTARIGDKSNLGIAGHRDGFFRGLQDIALGDALLLETLQGAQQYRVASIQIVDPADVHVLAPTDDSTVTLVTCYPFYFVGHAPQRYIVTAKAEPVQAKS